MNVNDEQKEYMLLVLDDRQQELNFILADEDGLCDLDDDERTEVQEELNMLQSVESALVIEEG